MRDRYQLDADTGRRQRAQTRLADGDERLDPIRHLRDAQILGLDRHFRLERGLTAAPATRLAAFGPAGRYAITDRRDAIGAGLRERHVDHAAECAGRDVFRPDAAALRRRDLQIVESTRPRPEK